MSATGLLLQWSALPKILSWLDREFQQIRIQANFEKKCRMVSFETTVISLHG